MKRILFFSLALTFVLIFSLKAQDKNINKETNEQEIEHEGRYHVGIFLGATSNLKHKTTDFSIGLDYEYKLDMLKQMLGFGFFMEAVFAEHKESLLGFPIYMHPGLGHLKFWIAPGIEFGDEAITSAKSTEILLRKTEFPLATESDDETTEFKTNFLFRAGIGYDFHFNMFAVSPAISLDVIKGNLAFVYGLILGMSF